MPELIRSFIAFDINNEEILKQLLDTQQRLATSGADLKLVEPKNIHVTMRFLGDIPSSMVDKVCGEMDQIAFSPFDVEIQGVGAFPTAKYARVVWAGIQEGADELLRVFTQLEPRLKSLGFNPDAKGFSPHITIARVRSGRSKTELAFVIKGLENTRFGTMKADCLKLKRSVLTPKGPVYSTLKEVCPR